MTPAKDNPFTTERVETLLPFEPEWIGQSWDAIDEALAANDHRGAIVGPHGSGKTTLLETLARRLRDRGEEVAPLFINRPRPRRRGRRAPRTGIPNDFFETLTPRTIILFDGAELLGPFAWRRFLGNAEVAPRLIVTGHRPGRLPTLFETKSSPAVLKRCIERLDANSKLDAGDLFYRHRGNLRSALLECYDLAAR